MEQKCTERSQHPPISDHVFGLIVRGIFFKLEYPYAYFGTKGITADFLFPIVWEGTRELESLGFKVICVTADGASSNRKFFHMHGKKEYLVYKTHNPFTDPKENRPLFFISYPPHVIKTAKNCWSHSGANGTRLMMVSK